MPFAVNKSSVFIVSAFMDLEAKGPSVGFKVRGGAWVRGDLWGTLCGVADINGDGDDLLVTKYSVL